MKLYSTYHCILTLGVLLTVGLNSCAPPSNKSEVAAKRSPSTKISKVKSNVGTDLSAINEEADEYIDAIAEQRKLDKEKIDKETLQELLIKARKYGVDSGVSTTQVEQVIKNCESGNIGCSDKNLEFLKDYSNKNKKDGVPIGFSIMKDGVMFSDNYINGSKNFRKFDNNGVDITSKELSNPSIETPGKISVTSTERVEAETVKYFV